MDLTPAHTVLLAVHYATNADIASLTTLAARHGAVLRKDLLLRILLGYLPEAVPSSEYVELIQAIEAGAIPELAPDPLDTSPVAALSRDAAVKKVRKLHLPPLHRDGGAGPEADGDDANPTVLFLLRRARRVDDEAGLLDELPALLAPFVGLAPCVRTLLVSAVLPLLRRNYEYHADEPIDYTLRAFEDLPDRVAAEELLSRTGAQAEDLEFVGRDLRGLVGPWLYDERRWTRRKAREGASGENAAEMDDAEASICPGWEQVLEWLMAQASRSWRVAVSAVDQWDGPSEADLGGYGAMWLSDDEQGHLEQTYARAALACAYLIPEPSVEALEGAFSIATKLSSLLDLDPGASLHAAAAVLAPVTAPNLGALIAPRHKRHLRNELLQNSNRLTATTPAAIKLLQALILSAFILTIAGSPTTVRKAAELALLQDERDQKAEAVKLIHTLSNNGPNNNDKYWIKARNEILWLRDWGSEEDGLSAAQAVKGVFGELTRECIEVEVLKALLANNRGSSRGRELVGLAMTRAVQASPSPGLYTKTLRTSRYHGSCSKTPSSRQP